MKLFKEVLEQVGKENLLQYVNENGEYTDFSKYIPYVMEQLEQMNPVLSEGELVIEKQGEHGFEWWGALLTLNENQYALDWKPWEEVLGTKVNVEKIKEKVEIENFVLSVLHNITFDGVDYRERQKNIEELLKRFED